MNRLMKWRILLFVIFYEKYKETSLSCRQNIEIYVIEVLNNNVGKIIIKQNIVKFIEIFNEKYCRRTKFLLQLNQSNLIQKRHWIDE